MNLLNLNSYAILEIVENDYEIDIKLSRKEKPQSCNYCNSPKQDKYGYKQATYLDLPIRNKRVALIIKLQRYKCKDCNKLYQDEVCDMSNEYRMTNRLLNYIIAKSCKSTFTNLANDIGVSEGTIRRIFSKHKNNTVNIATPKVLGIDEIYIAGKARCVLTDIESRNIYDMLKDRNKTTVIAYLQKLPDKQNIEYVTMDMWRPYKDAVNEVLPHAQIIVDKFHVVRMANNALEQCRKNIRKTLTSKQRLGLKGDRFTLLKREHKLGFNEQMTLSYWQQNYPVLYKAHYLKEQFFKIYDAKSKSEAYDLYEQWEVNLTSDVRHYYALLTTALSNWHNEIFAYFDYQVTNAYTESLNSVIRHIDRIGRGHGFEVIRGKVLTDIPN